MSGIGMRDRRSARPGRPVITGEAIVMAWRSLRAHRVRSSFTALGVTLGIAAVILTVGISDGIHTYCDEYYAGYARQITISPASPTGVAAARPLRESDGAALVSDPRARDISSAIPVLTGTSTARYEGRFYGAAVVGSRPEYLYLGHRELATGAMFTARQVHDGARVAAIGPELVTALFDGDSEAALGKPIRLDRKDFTVIGVLKHDGQLDNAAIVPISAARAYLIGGTDTINQILVQATGIEQVPAAVDQVNQIMSTRHRTRDPNKRDFSANPHVAILDKVDDLTRSITLNGGAIAALALLISSTGLANIMLVSVTARIPEIGIRRAVGARRRDIIAQFLIEAAALGGIGGILGVLLGIALVLLARVMFPVLQLDFGVPEISIVAILASLAASLVAGAAAGSYPAVHASRIPPVEAIRSD
jgi:putative ABC transport system permease protein